MIFHPPSWLPAIEQDLSAVSTVGDFVLRGPSGSASKKGADGNDLVTLTSADGQKSKTNHQVSADVEALAAGLAQDLQWSPNQPPAQGGKVVAVLSENTVDYLTYCWAVHRLRGTCLLLHASTAPAENAKHLQNGQCHILIVSPTLAEAGRAIAAAVGNVRVYLSEALPAAAAQTNGDANGAVNGTTNGHANGNTNGHTNGHTNGAVNGDAHTTIKTVAELMALGKTLDPLPILDWSPEEAQSSIAYLCATSGTSGTQKLARLTHRGIITNVLQLMVSESFSRKHDVEVVLGILPLSHVQGIVSSHSSLYMQDKLVLHGTFDMKAALGSIQVHRINRLYLVPSVLAALIGNPFLFKVFDLSSVDKIYVGAGILSSDLYAKVREAQPNWNVVIGYGLTESSVAVAMSSPYEHVQGSVGVLLPMYQARLVREDGSEVEAFEEPGELLLSSPNQAVGYLGDDEASAATFDNGWLHTGDVAVFRKSEKGDSHLCIVDRLKDMIKVKGLQVSPVAIEDCLRLHPGVADVAVIGVPDYLAGERAKAFVVPAKMPEKGADSEEAAALFEEWDEHVESKLTEPHWLKGRFELVDALPRTPSGKVSKGILRKRTSA